MPRFKRIDTNPKFLSVDLAKQLLPGTFEHALDHLIDHELDLWVFDGLYRNDHRGATAYPPGMLLKVVLFAYSRGIVTSRDIEDACQKHVIFIALCGDRAPHFTTIASFVARLADPIARIFSQVLYLCDREGLIGREMFAIDGVKLPSNASKKKSATRTDFQRQLRKLEAAAKTMLARHRAGDERAPEADLDEKEQARLERLQREAATLRRWLRKNKDERRGPNGKVRKSNLTDNESAKMATSKGVIQGYTGVATVDSKAQIIVDAQAHGTGNEQELLRSVLDAAQPFLAADSLVTADAGYHSAANLAMLAERQIDALVADPGMRKRDERLAEQREHHPRTDPLNDKSGKPKPQPRTVFTAAEFTYDPIADTCTCPAGQRLYHKGRNIVVRGRKALQFSGAKGVCGRCPLRERCLQTPETTLVRQVQILLGRADGTDHVERMKARIDSPDGRKLYGQRFGTVEPVFGNIRANKRLDRFTLRGKRKVDGQWKLYSLVHNIEKLMNHRFERAA